MLGEAVTAGKGQDAAAQTSLQMQKGNDAAIGAT